jgi:precorrin-6B methylase 2
MDVQTLQAELRRLGAATQTLAAIGAALRLLHAGGDGHQDTRTRLRTAIDALLPGTLADLDPQYVPAALAFITLQFYEASDLFCAPERSPGWAHRDPVVLQTMGDASRENMHNILALAVDRPGLAAALSGRFLDVGTGVGAIALEAAELCPVLRIVGIDIWEPALTLARANVAASPHAARIEIRALDVTALDEAAGFTLVWLPTAFMSRQVTEMAFDRVALALAPQGFVIVAVLALPAEAAAASLTELRIIRNGGHVWETADIEEQLLARGFVDVETCSGRMGVDLVLGRRPDNTAPTEQTT